MAVARRFPIMALCMGVALVLAGCSEPTPASSASSSVPPATATATATTTAPAPTVSPSTPSDGTSPTSPPAQPTPLALYYIAIGAGGQVGHPIGCGDAVIATATEPVLVADRVAASMQRLIATPGRTIPGTGLVNLLSTSHLTYVGSAVSGSTVTVRLSGTFSLGGTCDIPRVIAQLEDTARTAADTTNAVILVDGRPLKDVLSLK